MRPRTKVTNSNRWNALVYGIGMFAMLAMVACDKSASKADQGTSGASAPNPAAAAAAATASKPGSPSCALLSAAEVTALTGIPALKDAEKSGDSPVTMCGYSDGRLTPGASIRYETGRNAAEFAIIRKGHDDHDQKTTDLPSFAPGAFYISVASSTGVCFLHKNTVVFVLARAPLEKVTALARAVMQRM